EFSSYPAPGWPLLRRRSLPLDYIDQFPGVLFELELQFAFVINDELCCWIENTLTLAFVLIVEPDFACRKIKALRLRRRIALAEGDPAVGHKADGATSRAQNLPNEA